jgi:uncharacterized protein involved in exopolysaccharide biosynthesis
MNNQTNTRPNKLEEDTIDIIALARQLWLGRRWILKTTLVFAILGVFIALVSPVIYTAETTFIPQLNSSKSSSSSLKGLASLAGIDLSNMEGGSKEISPLIYPKLAQATNFNLELLAEPISYKDTLVSLETYFTKTNKGFSVEKLFGTIKKYTIGLPGLLLSNQKEPTSNANTSIIRLTAAKKELINTLKAIISVSPNEKEGFLTITAIHEDPLIAAQLTDLVTLKLQEEIIEKRLEKAKHNLLFVQEEYELNNREFQAIQNKLAQFKDRNQNISTARFMSNLQRLEAEYSIALNVVQQLASQLEQAKIKVNRDTPIFTVIEPVVVPTVRSAPKRGQIVLIWLFLGLLLSAGYLLAKEPLKELLSKITNKT